MASFLLRSSHASGRHRPRRVDNLAQGRLDEAMDLYESPCARGGLLGLLPEQIDPPSGAFLGNYPQAFSHIGVISSGVNLARLIARRES